MNKNQKRWDAFLIKRWSDFGNTAGVLYDYIKAVRPELIENNKIDYKNEKVMSEIKEECSKLKRSLYCKESERILYSRPVRAFINTCSPTMNEYLLLGGCELSLLLKIDNFEWIIPKQGKSG